jgi:hypothetical protein
MDMKCVQIAIRIQNAVVHVVKTAVVPKMEVVPWSVIASSQVGPHVRSDANHACSTQGATEVSMTETAEVSARNTAQSADVSAKPSDMPPTETSHMTSAEASDMSSAEASQVAAAKAAPPRQCVRAHYTADQSCCDQQSYRSSSS